MRKALSVAKKVLRRQQRRIAREEILVLGDSHVLVFEHWYWIFKYPRRYFHVCSVQGATASGLENPNATARAHGRFIEALSGSRFHRIILMLGEVDAGFVIWYRAKKYGVPPSETLQYAVESYCKFIDEVAGHGDLLVLSCPLPTIRDGIAQGEVANLRKEVDASQADQTAMTIRFNRAVEAYCRERGVAFANLDKDSVGPDDLVNSGLLNARPTDHHYHKRRYARLIDRNLAQFIAGCEP